MEEEAPNQKRKKNPSYPKPDGLKLKAIKWKKERQTTKKNHQSLNPTDLNQRQENEKNNTQIKKQNKNHHRLKATDFN